MRVGSQPVLGAAHAFDIPEFFGMGKQTSFIAVDSIGKYSGLYSEGGLAE